jgi:tetratricopeptide (TPR) repeat protein
MVHVCHSHRLAHCLRPGQLIRVSPTPRLCVFAQELSCPYSKTRYHDSEKPAPLGHRWSGLLHRLMRLFCLFCVAGALVLPACGQSTAPIAPLHQAEVLMSGGQLEQALQKLNGLAAEKPEPAGVEHLRGMVFYQQGKMAEAATAFAKAVAQNPQDREAMQMEGVSLFRQGKSAEAVPLLEQAHSSVPDANVDPNYVLGLCYLDTQRFDDARRAFAGQYGFAPDSAPAYLLAARMLMRRDYLPIAEETARKALALSPALPRIYLLLGEIALAQGQSAKAIADFEQELDLNPLDGTVYDRLGDAYIRAEDFDRAQHALDRAVLLEPAVSTPFILLGKVLLKQENPLMAKMYLEHAAQMDPGNHMAHYLLWRAYRALGRTEDAAREYQVADQIRRASTPHFESLR